MSNPLKKHIHLYASIDLYNKLVKKKRSHQPLIGVIEDMVIDAETQGYTVARLTDRVEVLEEDNKKLTKELELTKKEKANLIERLAMYENTNGWDV